METQEILNNQELVKIKEQTKDIVARVQSFRVVSDDTLTNAAKMISFIAEAKKQYENLCTTLVKPLNDHVKMINELFKKETIPLEEADKIVRGKMIIFQRAKEEAAEDEL